MILLDRQMDRRTGTGVGGWVGQVVDGGGGTGLVLTAAAALYTPHPTHLSLLPRSPVPFPRHSVCLSKRYSAGICGFL